ncbi:hypothetical protein V8D89_008803 [Ganoderma adspersum]
MWSRCSSLSTPGVLMTYCPCVVGAGKTKFHGNKWTPVDTRGDTVEPRNITRSGIVAFSRSSASHPSRLGNDVLAKIPVSPRCHWVAVCSCFSHSTNPFGCRGGGASAEALEVSLPVVISGCCTSIHPQGRPMAELYCSPHQRPSSNPRNCSAV